MKLVVRVKLLPTSEQASGLEATLYACNQAAAYASRIAFERGVKDRNGLQRLVYGELKTTFGLSAQPAVRVVKKVTDAYGALAAQARNGPDVAHDAIDLRAERVVVVGNGNVALDVARILLADPDTLARTDIADHALKALRASSVREVVLIGRRGPEDAAYTTPELLALKHVPGLQLLVDDHDPRIGAAIDAAGTNDKAAVLKGVPRGALDADVHRRPGGASSCASTACP